MVLSSPENSRTNTDSLLIFASGVIVFTIALSPEFVGFQNRFVLFAQEMLRYGPTFFPTTYRTAYPDYPATSTFLIYILSLPFHNVTVLTAVLPTAIVSALILVLIYRIGATQSRKWGLYAVFFALFTEEFLAESRSISLDQYTSLVTVSCFYLAYSASLLGRPRRLWLIPLLFAVGFAFRGPIGLVIPAAVTFVFYLWEKQYKKCLIFGAAALMLLGFCVAVMLAAAYRQGGNELLDRVVQAQAGGRMGYRAKNYFYYLLSGFTAYAVSFPLAVIVAGASWKKIFKRQTLNDRLPGHLVFWTAIILLGMSIPGAKKTRYILPVAPALSLLASYTFVRMESEGFAARAKDVFLSICRMLPVAGIVATAALCVPNKYFIPVPVFTGLVTLALLGGLAAAKRYRKSKAYLRDNLTAIPLAAMSFVVFNVGAIGPVMYLHERTRPFVEKVETLLASQPGTIAFYRIGPDGDDIKFVANASVLLTPVFIDDAEALLRQPSRAYFIARQKDFDRLPEEIVQKVQTLLYGKIGHRNCVVFAKRSDVKKSSSVILPDRNHI
jgi:4-amino-4-deoxy-L-arabinose transferase-like glycosyltransferase